MGKNPVSQVCEPQMSADIRAMDADEFSRSGRVYEFVGFRQLL
jgi:hypothetical protein